MLQAINRREAAKTVILFGLGAYFAWNIVSGSLANYINNRFAWLAYVAAALFFVLGAVNLFSLRRRDEPLTTAISTHTPVSDTALIILAAPLLLGTLIPSRPLGAEAIDGDVNTSVSAANMMTFTIPPEQRNILDWLRVFNNADEYTELSGQPADLIGFVYREPTFGENQFMAARFTVSCCVADASAIGVPVQIMDTETASAASITAGVEDGGWVRVRGTIEVADFRGEALPVLHAASIETVAQPEHPYLYP